MMDTETKNEFRRFALAAAIRMMYEKAETSTVDDLVYKRMARHLQAMLCEIKLD